MNQSKAGDEPGEVTEERRNGERRPGKGETGRGDRGEAKRGEASGKRGAASGLRLSSSDAIISSCRHFSFSLSLYRLPYPSSSRPIIPVPLGKAKITGFDLI